MMRSMSLTEMQDGVIYLDLEGSIGDPVLRRMAECLREIRPRIEGSAERYGHGTVLAALIAIVANMAIERGDAALIADAFRQNAEMLDVQAPPGTSVARA